jgi:Arc/MetJ-type ribon-helix-helix transcriptional regulator
MATDKVSVTIDSELVAEARTLIEEGLLPADSLSAAVNEGLRHQVLLARSRRALREFEERRGAIPEELLAEVDRLWPA